MFSSKLDHGASSPSERLITTPVGGPTTSVGSISDVGDTIVFQDKRNRNPNWTDAEIIRFLEILQEEDTMKDLMAQRNKQVFCYVAQRMCSEGADKTWDQCRVKLKNLKSNYRYVKDRIPNLDSLDLENENVVKTLIQDCQGRGISSSSIKHLRYLRRFVKKQNILGAQMGSDFGGSNEGETKIENTHDEEDADDPVSPPMTPIGSLMVESSTKRRSSSLIGGATSSSKKRRIVNAKGMESVRKEIQDGYKFIERFNRDMMEQFMEQQQKSQSNFLRWEQERFRMEQQSMERWRQEARDHEKQLFGMFCHVMTQCNSALNTILKAAQTAASASSVEDDNNDDDIAE